MSDASLKNLLRTSAFTFIMNDPKTMYTGRNVVPGEDDEQNSYYSKMCGILANMIVINVICVLHRIDEPYKVLVGCDNESALWNRLGDTSVNMKMASIDLVQVV